MTVVDFSYEGREGGECNQYFLRLVNRYKGHYYAYHGTSPDIDRPLKFQSLKNFMIDLAANLAIPLAVLDFKFKSVT